MTQRLCVTVTAPTMADLRRRRDEVVDADLVELRLDSVRDPDVARRVGRSPPPGHRHVPADVGRRVVLGIRGRTEASARRGPERGRRVRGRGGARRIRRSRRQYRRQANRPVCARFRRDAAGSRRAHPRDAGDRRGDRQGRGQDREAERLRDAARRRFACRQSRRPRVDRHGRSWDRHARASVAFQSAWTYAGALSGVGQLAPDTLLQDYRYRNLGPSTAVYGVVGSPVAHSVSPAMHNAAFRAAGLDAVYLPLPAVDVDDFVTFARAFGLKGASVTIPYKVAIFDRVDEPSALAGRIGAINTVRIERPVAGRQHRRQRLSRSAAGGSPAHRPAGIGARRGWCGPRRGDRPGVQRRTGERARAERQRAADVAALVSRIGRAVAAGARQLGSCS